MDPFNKIRKYVRKASSLKALNMLERKAQKTYKELLSNSKDMKDDVLHGIKTSYNDVIGMITDKKRKVRK